MAGEQAKRMNPEVKARWVAALRSGDYEQTRRKLADGQGGYCCLGVLCNLHAQEHPEIARQQKRSAYYMGMTKILPDAVANWAGLRNCGREEVRIGREKTILPAHNDTGRTFSEIAAAIEEQL